MAQYTPKTWTTGETITAAELNAIEQAAAAALPVADIPTSAALRAAYVPAARVTRTLPGRVCTDKCQTATTDTATAGTSRTVRTAKSAARDVRLVFAHFAVTGTGDGTPSGAITFSAAVELAGAVVPLTFGGLRTATLNGGLIWSDPLGIDLAPGDTLATRTYLASGSTNANYVTDPSASEGVATGDFTAAGAATVTPSFTFAFGPVAVIGGPDATVTKQNVLGICGDSIGFGQNDGLSHYTGFLIHAADAIGLPRVQVAVPGEVLRDIIVTGAYRYRMPLLTDCTHVVNQYGRNDFSQNRTTAQVQADSITFWTRIAARGPKVYQTTITPKSSSTDSWATTANQTTDPSNAARVGFNDWLRGGAPIQNGAAAAVGTAGALLAGQSGHPLTGVFDVADTVEAARNSGIWKAAYTDDGTHPNSTGHAAMTPAVNLSTLA